MAIRKTLRALAQQIPVLKTWVKPPCSAPTQAPPAPAPVVAPVVAPAPVAAPVVAPVVAPVATPAPAPAAPAAVAAPVPEANTVDEEKIRKHREKTKRGLLIQLHKQGGHQSLAELHDYSERRFFVAHRAFSTLMEEFVEEQLVIWDATSGLVTLTEEGRVYAEVRNAG